MPRLPWWADLGQTAPVTPAVQVDPNAIDVSPSDVAVAAGRVAGEVHRTPVVTSRQLDLAAGATVFCKCENLQRVGAFKFRGATNAVRSLTDAEAADGVACHSSGNHGAALSLAARRRGIPAHVVMPRNAPAVKRAAIEGYGAVITECEPNEQARRAGVAAVIARTGAVEIHPYDNPRVIAGAGTAAFELVDEVPDLDTVIVPVGGGGLLSGTALAVAGFSPGTVVIAVEPSGADDAQRSFRTGVLHPQDAPLTIADGLLTSLSARTLAIARRYVTDIVTVDDDQIAAAMRWTWERLKLVIEPSAAVPIAALHAGLIPGKRIGVILTGGNVDLDRLPWTAP
jgi:threonine dehydratase